MIACLIPAHNEQATIAATLDSVLAQTRRVDRIVVIADNCTDDTRYVVWKFWNEHQACGLTWLQTINNEDRKAGALNQGWPRVRDYDFILTMDADTILEPDFVEKTVGELEADPKLAGVCGRYWAKLSPPRPLGWSRAVHHKVRVVSHFQRLEYARFDDGRMLRDWKVSVLSGAAVLYRGEALRQVCAYREKTA